MILASKPHLHNNIFNRGDQSLQRVLYLNWHILLFPIETSKIQIPHPQLLNIPKIVMIFHWIGSPILRTICIFFKSSSPPFESYGCMETKLSKKAIEYQLISCKGLCRGQVNKTIQARLCSFLIIIPSGLSPLGAISSEDFIEMWFGGLEREFR